MNHREPEAPVQDEPAMPEFNLTLLDALHVAQRVWKKVGKSTIRNYFEKAEFIQEDLYVQTKRCTGKGRSSCLTFYEADERLSTGGFFTLEEIAEEMLCNDDITIEKEVVSFEEAQ
ncbi:hypothetical protein RF11_11222 [Thelohanellus kitauei]|uniref:Uncharacterized protein n=1 Tax=Thelohanellus kitauei TaxID=669202 RepID=A0A0C2MZX6_THEKT|nr:hypothetical protein RF11_11222 [Thelohanellus kitauei]